jgi:hypothetical protein
MKDWRGAQSKQTWRVSKKVVCVTFKKCNLITLLEQNSFHVGLLFMCFTIKDDRMNLALADTLYGVNVQYLYLEQPKTPVPQTQQKVFWCIDMKV